jgi:mRNA-degrading endonuclease toxin of MazEF toxin-antitoxin module
MKDQFQIWSYDFLDKGGTHPVVLISHPDRCARAGVVNVLFCTSQRQSRGIKPTEVLLNGADGLDWETYCDCSILYAVPSAKLMVKRGQVSLERRNAIRDKLRDVFRLSARD